MKHKDESYALFPCYAMLCYAMLCYAMLCYAMLCHVMFCRVVLCYYAMLCLTSSLLNAVSSSDELPTKFNAHINNSVNLRSVSFHRLRQ